jgi:anti-sigma regulatory factor (Ser/Thr protein kinase)
MDCSAGDRVERAVTDRERCRVNEVRLALERSLHAPRQARHALGEWLTGLSCPEHIASDALVVVSELVTNAVVHAHSDPLVVAAFDEDRLRIEVHDQDPNPPVMAPTAGEPGGFGLRIVERLCDAWGWAATEHGKRVWTETLC